MAPEHVDEFQAEPVVYTVIFATGRAEQFSAHGVKFDGGALVFTDEIGRLVKAHAPGRWSIVYPTPAGAVEAHE